MREIHIEPESFVGMMSQREIISLATRETKESNILSLTGRRRVG